MSPESLNIYNLNIFYIQKGPKVSSLKTFAKSLGELGTKNQSYSNGDFGGAYVQSGTQNN